MNLPKRRPGVSTNQPASRSAPQASTSHGAAPISLSMTTVAKDNKSETRQFSAGSSISRTSRQAEEEKVEQLKHMNLVFIENLSGFSLRNLFKGTCLLTHIVGELWGNFRG